MVTGKLAEMLYMMTKERILIAGLTEAGCKDTAVYNSGEYYVILLSGATADRTAGVLFRGPPFAGNLYADFPAGPRTGRDADALHHGRVQHVSPDIFTI